MEFPSIPVGDLQRDSTSLLEVPLGKRNLLIRQTDPPLNRLVVMQPGKWIKDLAPAMAVDAAARRVLTIRFDTVRQALAEVLVETDDPESVHQLRVASRRAGAAVWLFRELVPAKVAKKAKQGLKAIRQSAGEVRDGDVLLGRLRTAAKELDEQDRPAIDFLIGYLVAKRLPVSGGFVELVARFLKKLDKLSSKAVESITSVEPGQRMIELARDNLASQLKKFDRVLAEESHELSALHEARIIGKRLRYTMEIVADCYPDEFRKEHYSVVEELQEILGEIHDHDVTVQLYTQLNEQLPAVVKKRAKRYRPTLDRLIDHHQSAIAAALPRFDAWKQTWPSHHAALLTMIENESPTASSNGTSTPETSTNVSYDSDIS